MSVSLLVLSSTGLAHLFHELLGRFLLQLFGGGGRIVDFHGADHSGQLSGIDVAQTQDGDEAGRVPLDATGDLIQRVLIQRRRIGVEAGVLQHRFRQQGQSGVVWKQRMTLEVFLQVSTRGVRRPFHGQAEDLLGSGCKVFDDPFPRFDRIHQHD